MDKDKRALCNFNSSLSFLFYLIATDELCSNEWINLGTFNYNIFINSYCSRIVTTGQNLNPYMLPSINIRKIYKRKILLQLRWRSCKSKLLRLLGGLWPFDAEFIAYGSKVLSFIRFHYPLFIFIRLLSITYYKFMITVDGAATFFAWAWITCARIHICRISQ